MSFTPRNDLTLGRGDGKCHGASWNEIVIASDHCGDHDEFPRGTTGCTLNRDWPDSGYSITMSSPKVLQVSFVAV